MSGNGELGFLEIDREASRVPDGDKALAQLATSLANDGVATDQPGHIQRTRRAAEDRVRRCRGGAKTARAAPDRAPAARLANDRLLPAGAPQGWRGPGEWRCRLVPICRYPLPYQGHHSR